MEHLHRDDRWLCHLPAGVEGDVILVIDVGTSGVRAAVVTPGGEVTCVNHREVLPTSPMPMFGECAAVGRGEGARDVPRRSLTEGGPVEAVGIANQRASTIVWDRATGEPVGPGVGWQDLRTVGSCLALQADGIRL